MAALGLRTAFAVAAISVGMTLAPPAAHADDPSLVGPAVGSPCTHAQQNTVTTANSGDQIRCAAVYGQGYMWLPDVGPQQDPRFTDPQMTPEVEANSYNYCLIHSDRPWECLVFIYGTP